MNSLMILVSLPLVLAPLVYFAGHSRLHWLTPSRSSIFMLLVLWFALGIAANGLVDSLTMTYQLGTICLCMDDLSLVMSGLTLLLGTCTILYSAVYMADEHNKEKYYAQMLLLMGSVIGLVNAGDLFNLWIWFEIMAVSSYLLVALDHTNPYALGACVKYFVQTVSGSIFILFGVALVLLKAGTLDLAYLAAEVQPSPLLTVAGALFVLGFGVKAALVPSYTWLPDAYAESPAPVSALLAGVVTISSLIALFRALAAVAWSPEQWGVLLMVIGSLNIVLGNMLAFAQTQIKRILAYSSISHIGLILLALGIGLTIGSADAMASGMLHLIVHGLMKTLAFLAVGALAFHWRVHTGVERLLTLPDLGCVARHYPGIALALTLSLLSLVGIPPLAGFYSKLRILYAGITSDTGLVILLTVFAALNSVLSLGYYLPIINAMYLKGEVTDDPVIIPMTMRVPVYVLTVLIVVLGFVPGLVDPLAEASGTALLALFGR